VRPADNINNLIKKLKLKASTDLDKRVHDDISMALAESDKTKSAVMQPKIGRIIMKSPITKLATAAVVIIACVIGLSLWRTTGSGIALADVLARIEQIKAVRYKWNYTLSIYTGPDKTYNQEIRATVLNSGEYGTQSNLEWLDPNGGESTFSEEYFLPHKKTVISINHIQKAYSRRVLRDARVELMQKENPDIKDPLAFVRRILKTKYESLGRSTIDGTEVTVFQTTDPDFIREFSKLKEPQTDVKIWVDVETLLPVRIDNLTSYQIGGDRRRRMIEHTVMYDFQWDASIEPDGFEPPPIPDGYTIRDMFPDIANEENATQGLKQCVELLGNYPERIDLTYLWSESERSKTTEALRVKEELKGLTGLERDNRKMDALKPMRFLNKFYLGLASKDSAYYGKTVTPKDADKVLLRWKVSDNEYRVIYGDLHAETVTSEKLSELEKALPE